MCYHARCPTIRAGARALQCHDQICVAAGLEAEAELALNQLAARRDPCEMDEAGARDRCPI